MRRRPPFAHRECGADRFGGREQRRGSAPRPAGRGRLHGVGVRPTVPARQTLKGLAEGRDEPLERAVELVRRAG
ncbi:MAG: hypothetical protein K2X87_04135 [Gemmataceae bacterium]|nr:hypothetical protein [Gemmataceae bacterium]